MKTESPVCCAGCGDEITPGTLNATGCTLTLSGWSCGECEFSNNIKYFKEDIQDEKDPE